MTAFEIVVVCLLAALVVFVGLGSVGGLMYLHSLRVASRPRTRAATAPGVEAGTPGALDARTLAILTAAACAALGRPVRVRRASILHENPASAWRETGRVAVQSSHRLGRRSL